MHLIAISFWFGQLKDSFYIDIHVGAKPFHEMQKKAAGRNADKGEGVAGEPCLRGSYQSSDGEMDAIQHAHNPKPVHPSPVCMHAWRYTYAS